MPRQQISNSQFAVTALCSKPEALPRVGSENAAEAGFERWAEAARRLDGDTAAFMTALSPPAPQKAPVRRSMTKGQLENMTGCPGANTLTSTSPAARPGRSWIVACRYNL